MQRCSSDLRVNPHFHALLLDGIYIKDKHDALPRFVAMPKPTDEEVKKLAEEAAKLAEAEDVRRSYGNPLIVGKQKIEATSADEILKVADVGRGIWKLGREDGKYHVLFLDKDKVLAVPEVELADQVFPEFSWSAYEQQGISLDQEYIFDWIERNRDLSLVRVVPEEVRQELASGYGEGTKYFSHYLTVPNRPQPRTTPPVYGPRYPVPRRDRRNLSSVDANRVREVYSGLYSMPSTSDYVRTSDGRLFRLENRGSSISEWETFSEYREVDE